MTNPVIIKLEVSLPNANPQSYEHIKKLVLDHNNNDYMEAEVINTKCMRLQNILCFLGIHKFKWHSQSYDGYAGQRGMCECCGYIKDKSL